jgi:hypothetical protein
VGREQGPHNTYLSLAADLGVVGVGLFLLILISIAGRSLRLKARQQRYLVNVLLVTLAIGLLPGHWERIKVTWLMIAILLAETTRVMSGRESMTSSAERISQDTRTIREQVA